MAESCRTDLELCPRERGDTYPLVFALNDGAETPAPVDVTGWAFTFTLDPSDAPDDGSGNVWSLAGTITDAPGGVVEFAPSAGDADLAPGTYFWDIEALLPGGAIRTVARGSLPIRQDIGK